MLRKGPEAVKAKAAFELDCPEDQLTLTPLTMVEDVPMSYGVTGCSHKTVYDLKCAGTIYRQDCNAIRGSEIQKL